MLSFVHPLLYLFFSSLSTPSSLATTYPSPSLHCTRNATILKVSINDSSSIENSASAANHFYYSSNRAFRMDFNAPGLDKSTISIKSAILRVVITTANSATLTIETKRGIVHTRWDSFGGVYLVPMKKGEFKAKATFMCAEYENPEEMEITFVCK